MYAIADGKMILAADATVPLDNGAFRYGHGLFETMLVEDGIIQLQVYHMERLFAGIRQLGFELPALMDAAYFTSEVLRLVQKNRLEALCRVRLQVYAGGGGLYGREAQKAGHVIECFAIDKEAHGLNENGLVAGIAAGISKSPDALSNLKSCNALIYAAAARYALEQRWNEALICNTHGHIIESTIANIFWVKNGQIYTPPLTDGCVAGVMRRHIMQLAGNVEERSLTPEALSDADEVFLSNAIRKVRWIGVIGGRTYGNEHARRLAALLYRN